MSSSAYAVAHRCSRDWWECVCDDERRGVCRPGSIREIAWLLKSANDQLSDAPTVSREVADAFTFLHSAVDALAEYVEARAEDVDHPSHLNKRRRRLKRA
jgi:hypothetical protein